MIDKLIYILGEMPKRKRNATLKTIDMIFYPIITISFFIKLPFLLDLVIFVGCVIMVALNIRLLQIGGWWWTDDGN